MSKNRFQIVIVLIIGITTVLFLMIYDRLDKDVLIVEELESVYDTIFFDTNAGKSDINQATLEDLMNLDGIGEVLATRIIDKREELNGFTSMNEIDEIEGIGTVLLVTIEEYFYVE